MPPADAPDYKWLVQDDRIHAAVYTDPKIFDDEMERIFRRGWVFVGHDSEVPAAGDFITVAPTGIDLDERFAEPFWLEVRRIG